MVEDSEREIEENTPDEGEIELPSTSQMGSADMWVHAKENILLNGRTQHQEVEDDGSNPDFDPEEAKKAQEKQDPYEPRLKPLSLDE